MPQYKAKQTAKLWKDKALTANIGQIDVDDIVTGSNIGDGVLQLTSPVGYTKALWFTVITVTPPPPPVTKKIKYIIETFTDGSVTIKDANGNVIESYA